MRRVMLLALLSGALVLAGCTGKMTTLKPGRVLGVVLEGDAPVAGISVVVASKSYTTNAQGEFTTDSLAGGNHSYACSDPSPFDPMSQTDHYVNSTGVVSVNGDVTLVIQMSRAMAVAKSTLDVQMAAITDAVATTAVLAGGFRQAGYQPPTAVADIFAPDFRWFDPVAESEEVTYMTLDQDGNPVPLPDQSVVVSPGLTWDEFMQHYKAIVRYVRADDPGVGELVLNLEDQNARLLDYTASPETMQQEAVYTTRWTGTGETRYARFKVDFVNIDGIWKISRQEMLEYLDGPPED